jgi:hypothetical protein
VPQGVVKVLCRHLGLRRGCPRYGHMTKTGLRASVAQHMWLDVIASVVNYLFEAGVTRGQDTSLSLNIQFSIWPKE